MKLKMQMHRTTRKKLHGGMDTFFKMCKNLNKKIPNISDTDTSDDSNSGSDSKRKKLCKEIISISDSSSSSNSNSNSKSNRKKENDEHLVELLSARFEPLSDKKNEMINDVYARCSKQTNADLIHTYIRMDDLCRLKPRQWLNDNIINYVGEYLIAKRDEQLCKIYPQRKRLHYFIVGFMDFLFNGYDAVKGWTKKINIFELSKIFCPVNIDNSHWVLCVIFMEKKEIVFYDSFHSKGDKYLNALLDYVEKEAERRGNKSFDKKEWTCKNGDPPKQKNGYDCGVFTIMCMDFLSDNLPLSFEQSDMNDFRRKITYHVAYEASLDYPSVLYNETR